MKTFVYSLLTALAIAKQDLIERPDEDPFLFDLLNHADLVD